MFAPAGAETSEAQFVPLEDADAETDGDQTGVITQEEDEDELNRPTGRGKPACVHENVGLAMTVGDLQDDVFIKGSTFDRLTFQRRPHFSFPSSELYSSSVHESITRPDYGPPWGRSGDVRQ